MRKILGAGFSFECHQICSEVVYIGIGVLAEQIAVRFEGIVNFDSGRRAFPRKGMIVAGSVTQGDAEIIDAIQRAGNRRSGGWSHGHRNGTPRRSGASSTAASTTPAA